jgi:DNA-binding response OmpR family regulator
MAGDRGKALEAGCNDYDTKPVEFKRLLGKIEELL